MKASADPDRQTQEVFDRLAGSQFFHFQSALRGGVFDARSLTRAVCEVCDPPTGDVTALEVGSGLGDKTPLLHEMLVGFGCQSPRITGIDFSSKSVAVAAARRNHGVTYEPINFLGEGLKDRTFDYVFLAAVCHHFPDMRQGIAKILRHLKPEGVALILNTFYPESPVLRLPALALQRLYRLALARGNAHYNRLTAETVASLIEEAQGLEYRGDIPLDFPLSLINTRLLVAQRVAAV